MNKALLFWLLNQVKLIKPDNIKLIDVTINLITGVRGENFRRLDIILNGFIGNKKETINIKYTIDDPIYRELLLKSVKYYPPRGKKYIAILYYIDYLGGGHSSINIISC